MAQAGEEWACLTPVPTAGARPFMQAAVSINKNPFTVGRVKVQGQEVPSLSVQNPAISSKHCFFTKEKDAGQAGAAIEALGAQWVVKLTDTSMNGVYVNGVCVGNGKAVVLKTGDKVQLVKPDKPEMDQYAMEYEFKDHSNRNSEEALLLRDINEHYYLDEVIGAGSYASVRRATHKQTGKQVAVKVINLKKMEMTDSSITLHKQYREVKILRKVDHPSTVRVLDIFAAEGTLHLVMELATGGDLFDLITKRGTVTPEDAKVMFKQLLGAVGYLHAMGIAHRDIKPENILLGKADDVKSIKLTDFGLAKGFDAGTMLKTRCGTPMYVAPEIMKRTMNLKYTAAVDVWSLGVVLWVMLTARPPFPKMAASSSHYNYAAPLNWTVKPLPRILSAHPAVRDIIESMLKIIPSERPDIATLLQHPWIAPPTQGENGAALCPPPPKRPAGDDGPESPAKRPKIDASG
eukprot:TRINITY_DN20925_c0_g1_i1.p1 TRINITY_DN20925_c0_g1~~TRINITY_DN20925_c0_g1_i1.p1  ORF type:complete len:462 (+),score=143.71 TRINITY_DN20925_c0_g1_i1:42-1427(+)